MPDPDDVPLALAPEVAVGDTDDRTTLVPDTIGSSAVPSEYALT